MAGFSYPTAVILNALQDKKGQDLVLTVIEFELDGKPFSASALKSFVHGPAAMVVAYERPEIAAVFGQSVEEAVNRAIEAIKLSRTGR